MHLSQCIFSFGHLMTFGGKHANNKVLGATENAFLFAVLSVYLILQVSINICIILVNMRKTLKRGRITEESLRVLCTPVSGLA